ncbi:hypothetical protein KHM83_10880 [Fusibacter paucivorans]|uniref:HTH crp-type domain-containing protein n=1 Tax=Fusibacter paucivorans TaxID=76009 RepID=A0ABS5PPT5_9FIRM|nr:hypothetical protein [Fusibacter paucivorans]MBS7527184.1 hypothetical protein [Fusibacter paucivorans]
MWSQIKREIFENEQMDIYEKMCLLVLMAQEEEVELSSEELARYMGCTAVTAKRAFEALQQKGYLASEEEAVSDVLEAMAPSSPYEKVKKTLDDYSGNVVSGESAEQTSQIFLEPTDHFREGFFIDGMAEAQEEADAEAQTEAAGSEAVKTSGEAEEERRARLRAYLLGDEKPPEKPFVSVKEAKNRLVDQVIEIIDEKISFKEANIILGFSGNDIERIKRKYKIAKMSQVSDTIGVLINELQKPEELDKGGRPSNVIKADILDDEETPPTASKQHAVESQRSTQVNAMQILRMQAYQKQKKGPKA